MDRFIRTEPLCAIPAGLLIVIAPLDLLLSIVGVIAVDRPDIGMAVANGLIAAFLFCLLGVLVFVRKGLPFRLAVGGTIGFALLLAIPAIFGHHHLTPAELNAEITQKSRTLSAASSLDGSTRQTSRQ